MQPLNAHACIPLRHGYSTGVASVATHLGGSEEALLEIRDIKKRVREGEDPEEILLEDYGLEPDYVMDLI